jgi:hypothetical protein
MTYPDEETYEGEYKHDKRYGHGVYKYKDGNKYTGDWKDDMREGTGTTYHSL